MYPPTRRVDAKSVYHGVTVADPYRWLEDGNDPEVKTWVKAQDDLALSKLRKLPIRDSLLSRAKEVLFAGDAQVPSRFGSRYFYTRRDKGKEKAIVYARELGTQSERVLIDTPRWPAEQTLQGYWPSNDGRKVAYRVSKNNADLSTLRVLDVETGNDSVVDTIYPVRFGNLSWSADSRGFYYRLDASDSAPSAEQTGRASVRYHAIGTDPKHDAVVREPTMNSQRFEEVIASRDGRWLFLRTEVGSTGTDWYYRDAKQPKAQWTAIVAGLEHQYTIIDHQGAFYVKTDDGAPRGHLLRVDPKHPERTAWREIVSERPNATLNGFAVAGNRLLLLWNRDASTELEIRELDGTRARTVELPTLGGVGAGGVSETATVFARPEDDEAFFRFESYATPPHIYSLSLKTGVIRTWAHVDVPGVDPSQYAVERIFYASKDGTKVPMFVVHRRDVPLDGRAPALLIGYGGFAESLAPYFTSTNYMWVERGGVLFEPASRGGAEYGEAWHRAGMLTNKQNVFDDHIAAAEEMVRRGWARPERMGVRGGSNGGLMAAAVIVQRPDLFRVAVCAMPVIDVIRSPLFGNGKDWEAEYGSPENQEQFKAMLAYSPYHNVKTGVRYPALLVATADSDDRVDPMHARKFAAAMQSVASDRPVLLQVRHETGHFGSDNVSARAGYGADMHAFLLWEMGVR